MSICQRSPGHVVAPIQSQGRFSLGGRRRAAGHGDAMIATEPDGNLVSAYRECGATASRATACYDTGDGGARGNALRLWRGATPGWHVMPELPG